MSSLSFLLAFVLSQNTGDTRAIDFSAGAAGEAVATIAAGCAGREAVLLEVTVDGRYSQHIALTRGEAVADYRVVLGPVSAGAHHVAIARDAKRSASGAGAVTFGSSKVDVVPAGTPDYDCISRAPILRARPGTVEKFSDFPLVMYAERNVDGEAAAGISFSTPSSSPTRTAARRRIA
jgi:hypothetical protein